MTTASVCALNQKPNEDGTCLAPEHIQLVSNYTEANTLEDIKAETNCADDECVIDAAAMPTEVKEKIKREALKAPTGSYDNNYWLNNTEIDTVMSQFRQQYPGFAHGFIHMIDLKAFSPTNANSFDYPVMSAPDTDFAQEFKHGFIHRGIIEGSSSYKPKLSTFSDTPLSSYGIVCNTDSSTGSGQHWFALFISTDHKDPKNASKPWIRIEVFNSAGGGSANQEFNSFWQKQAILIAKATGLKCTFDVITTIAHQRDDTGNCGSYSLFYIYSRLQDALPHEFNDPKRPIRDSAMKKFREVVFRISDDPFKVDG